MSGAPDLVQDADQDQCQSAPNKQDLLQTNVADGGYIILHVWIAIEILMPPAEDKDSGSQEDKDCDAEGNAQRGNAGLFNRGNKRDHRITGHFDFRNGV
ncbi:MAG: hypothetical protein DME86_12085 [Verrucomicrobia bacterium]|nr:MAG: hypothetical protein DME86_12085 [Verrucomicrobiota bacterium]